MWVTNLQNKNETSKMKCRWTGKTCHAKLIIQWFKFQHSKNQNLTAVQEPSVCRSVCKQTFRDSTRQNHRPPSIAKIHDSSPKSLQRRPWRGDGRDSKSRNRAAQKQKPRQTPFAYYLFYFSPEFEQRAACRTAELRSCSSQWKKFKIDFSNMSTNWVK